MPHPQTACHAAMALSMLLAASAAHALSTTVVSTTNISGATASCSARGSCWAMASNGNTMLLNQFNAEAGVLTGARLSASMGNTVLSYSSNVAGNATYRQSLSYGQSLIEHRWTVGNTSNVGGALDSGQGSVPANYLFSLIGTGQVGASAYYELQVNKNGGNGFNTTSATATVSPHTLTGSMTYDYLRHANASFAAGSDSNVLDLSAGDAFSVFALGSATDTTRLDAGSISCSGDCSAFSLGLASFQDLVAGQSVGGLTSLISGLAGGQYDATYTLNFADDNALGVGQRSNALTLHLSGAVTAVPEPASGALMLGGLLALGAWRRRPHA